MGIFRHFYHPAIWLLFLFVFVDEGVKTTLIDLASRLSIPTMALVFPMLGLQAICAPIQATISDYYCRKKSLLVAMAVLVACILIFRIAPVQNSWWLLLPFVLKGLAGNVIPIARAGIADTRGKHVFRLALAFSICAIALGSFGPTHLLHVIKSETVLVTIVALASLSLVICMVWFEDKKDKDPHQGKHSFRADLKAVYTKYLRSRKCLLALGAYFLAEVSFYQLLFREEVFGGTSAFRHVLELGIGYYLGTMILACLRTSDQQNIVMGIVASTGSLLFYLVFGLFGLNPDVLGNVWVAGYAMGFAIFIPSLFSLVSKDQPLHDQGKIYGLIDATDTVASLVAFGIVFAWPSASISFCLLCSSAIILGSLMVCIETVRSHRAATG